MRCKSKVYREYIILKNTSVFFTGLYLVVLCIILYNVQEEVPATVEFISVALWYLLPILILLCWYMCYERYMKLSLEGKEEHEKRIVQKNVQLIWVKNIYWGAGFFICLCVNAFFLIRYGEAFEQIFCYYLIIFVITVIWLIGLLSRHKRVRRKRFYYLVFAGISIIVLLIVIEKTNAFVFIQKMNRMTI